MMFKKKRSKPATIYSQPQYIPILRCSICTGEQTAGFRDTRTGTFHDIMLIRNDKDLEEFKKMYGVEDLKKEY